MYKNKSDICINLVHDYWHCELFTVRRSWPIDADATVEKQLADFP